MRPPEVTSPVGKAAHVAVRVVVLIVVAAVSYLGSPVIEVVRCSCSSACKGNTVLVVVVVDVVVRDRDRYRSSPSGSAQAEWEA